MKIVVIFYYIQISEKDEENFNMNTALQTLEMIENLKNASASEIANELGIRQSTFSNRANHLISKSLITRTSQGKEKHYSLTESGRLFLKRNNEKNTCSSIDSRLMKTLEMLIKQSFDNAYRIIDIFFEEPICSFATHYIQGDFEINPLDPLVADSYRNLMEYIYISVTEKYTKEQFFTYLIITGNYSHEVKGFIYYIANKYNEFIKSNMGTRSSISNCSTPLQEFSFCVTAKNNSQE